MPLIQYGQVESGIATDVTRITEASDTRITEAGDTRITNDVVVNNVNSYLNAIPTLTTFYQNMYYNVGGSWKVSTPYVKHNGTWKLPDQIYIKQSGNWKRVY
jgi:hypothetical protein